MNNNVSHTTFSNIKKMQQNELTESHIYKEIANFSKGANNKEVLLRLSKEQKSHYEIWKKYTSVKMKPQKFKIFI